MLKELHVIFSGKVQGVGFRYTTKQHAIKLGIRGAVKNLPDGTVELVAQGEDSKVLKLIQLLEEEGFAGKIKEKKMTLRTLTHSYVDFQIL